MELVEPGSSAFYAYLSVVVGCVLLSGIMSGLTTGLASIDRLTLEIDAKEDIKAHKIAVRIFNVIDRHHWMLVTLLLVNALCMEIMPIYLVKICPEAIAIVLSVTLILLFGEIIPQAVCTGPAQL